jgi:hypothetical protein
MINTFAPNVVEHARMATLELATIMIEIAAE